MLTQKSYLKILPTFISSQETTYVQKQIHWESNKLISDIVEISDWFNIKGFLEAMDIETAFDSLENNFLSSILTKFGFGKNFIT